MTFTESTWRSTLRMSIHNVELASSLMALEVVVESVATALGRSARQSAIATPAAMLNRIGNRESMDVTGSSDQRVIDLPVQRNGHALRVGRCLAIHNLP